MISIKGVSYRYPSGKEIVFPDFRAEKGAHILLLGDSGSGKTTLLHLLGGLLRSQRGSITVVGHDITAMTETELDAFRGKYTGFIFQKNHLVPSLSVKKNLLLSPWLAGMKQDLSSLERVLEHLGLSEYENSNVTELSQGQAQRVAIARAVLNNPSIIFADEPTSALDDKNADRVAALLTQVASEVKSTLIIATHDHRLKSTIRDHIRLTGD
jgi:ABC-type lipoprotein export system ATPase subunit